MALNGQEKLFRLAPRPRIHTLFTVCVATLIISGCTSSIRKYSWGKYEDQLFTHYHTPAKSPQVLSNMASHIAYLENAGRVVPPGLYAELGTLYLQRGDKQSAVAYYDKERQLWPESHKLMSSLIQSLASNGPSTPQSKNEPAETSPNTTQKGSAK